MSGPDLVEVLPSEGGGYYWRTKAANNEITGTSGSETYEHPTDCKAAAKRLFGEDVAFRVVYRKDTDGG